MYFPLCYYPVLLFLSFCLLSFIFALSLTQLFHPQGANLCAQTGRFVRAKMAWSKTFVPEVMCHNSLSILSVGSKIGIWGLASMKFFCNNIYKT